MQDSLGERRVFCCFHVVTSGRKCKRYILNVLDEGGSFCKREGDPKQRINYALPKEETWLSNNVS